MSGLLTNALTGGIPGAISAVSALAGKVLDRALPDPAARAAAELELAKLDNAAFLAELAADTGLLQAQAATNTAEAQSDRLLVSGWRPAMGWVCVAAVGLQGGASFLSWASAALGRPVALPGLDLGLFMPIILGMLGLRTYEKSQGISSVATGH